jgi:fucose permease
VLLLWLHGGQSGPWMQAMVSRFVRAAILNLFCHSLMRASHMQRVTISLQHCCFGIGALVAPLFVRASQGATSSFHAAFWVFSFILCCSAVSFLFLPSPSPPHATSQHDEPGFIAALRRMSRAAKCLLFSVALLLGVFVGSEVSFGAYLLVYSHQGLGFDVVPSLGPPPPTLHPCAAELRAVPDSTLLVLNPHPAPLRLALHWHSHRLSRRGHIALGRFLAVFVSMRLSPKQMLWIDFAGCVFWSALLLAYSSKVVLWLCSAMFGLFMASIFPTVLTLAESFMPISGKVATVFVVGASLGELALPAVVGYVFVNMGAMSFAWAILLFSVVSVAVFLLVLQAGAIVTPSMKALSEQKPVVEGSEEEAQAGMLELDMLKAGQL